MPANIVRLAKQLDARWPGRAGVLNTAGTGPTPPGELSHALDNGRYASWAHGKPWSEHAFCVSLRWCERQPTPLSWVAVPDVVLDGAATLKEWDVWAGKLKADWGFPLALCVQNGMAPADLGRLDPYPDVVFIGGTTSWKWRTLRLWTASHPRIHVGRVNSERLLWMAHRAGVESTDGTGWSRTGTESLEKVRLRGLVRYLDRSSRGLPENDRVSLLDLVRLEGQS